MSQQDTINLLTEVMRPLAQWGAMSGVDEIAINEPNVVFVRLDGMWNRHEIDFSYDDCVDTAILAGALRRQTVDEASPLVGTDIPFCGNKQRLQAVLPPAVPDGTVSLTIRRFETTMERIRESIASRYDTSRWNQWTKRNEARQSDFAEALRVFDGGDLDAFLDTAVRMHLNVLLCGATGSGKTSLARSLLGLVDLNERIITIEDALELTLPHKNCVRLLYSKGGLSADGVTSTDLLTATMRMRPSRIVLQELRDPEAAYVFVNEGLTGHPGCLTTIHGGSASEAFKRLFTLIKGSDQGRAYDDDVILGLLESAVDVIMPLHNDGSTYSIRETWFASDAARRSETARSLMGE